MTRKTAWPPAKHTNLSLDFARNFICKTFIKVSADIAEMHAFVLGNTVGIRAFINSVLVQLSRYLNSVIWREAAMLRSVSEDV